MKKKVIEFNIIKKWDFVRNCYAFKLLRMPASYTITTIYQNEQYADFDDDSMVELLEKVFDSYLKEITEGKILLKDFFIEV